MIVTQIKLYSPRVAQEQEPYYERIVLNKDNSKSKVPLYLCLHLDALIRRTLILSWVPQQNTIANL